ncbi:MAG: methylmalonyl-CoA epimerase [Gemmatimonadota bacterium]
MAIIDHIGIAVNSLETARPLYAALLGENAAGEEEVPEEGVRVVFFGEGEGRVELLEALGPNSSIARFLERRGAGVHHVCLIVPDVGAAVERARAAGSEPVSPAVRRGAGGSVVAFLDPRTTGGVLIELKERRDRRTERG